MPPPFVALVVRPDSGNAEPAPVRTPSQFNQRPTETVAPQQAPDPIRYGDTPARPARMPLYSVVTAKDWRSIMYDAQSGVIGKTEFRQFVSSPRGKALTWDERANIEHDQPDAYGSFFSLSPYSDDEIKRIQMGM